MGHAGSVDIGFRPLHSDDLPVLAAWLARPHVARWWRDDPDPAVVESTYLPVIDGRDPTEAFVVLVDGTAVGYIQRYRADDYPTWRAAVRVAVLDVPSIGLDYLIGEVDRTGRGIGTRMLSAFVEETWDRYPDADRIVVAVQQDNVASWRALASAGFTRAWSGTLDSDDPSDRGPSHVYLMTRVTPPRP